MRGLVVNRFSAFGIYLDATTAGNNAVEGCYVGTDVTGSIAEGNTYDGVFIFGSHGYNRIGTDGDGVSDTAERNIISGNAFGGIGIEGTGDYADKILPTEPNTVAGNYVGTDATGTKALGNSEVGVDIEGWQDNLIGANGADADPTAERNVISGNPTNGVVIAEGADGTVVAGNYIGTDATGTLAAGQQFRHQHHFFDQPLSHRHKRRRRGRRASNATSSRATQPSVWTRKMAWPSSASPATTLAPTPQAPWPSETDSRTSTSPTASTT